MRSKSPCNCYHYYSLALVLHLLLLLGGVQGKGQHEEEVVEEIACNLLYDCRSCLYNGTNCVFAAGECWTECTQGDTGASCYSLASHPDMDYQQICNLYDMDNLLCNAQVTCQSCLVTLKSDLLPCQWYPAALNNQGACFGGGNGPFGIGNSHCDDTTTTTTPFPTSTPGSFTYPPVSTPPSTTTPGSFTYPPVSSFPTATTSSSTNLPTMFPSSTTGITGTTPAPSTTTITTPTVTTPTMPESTCQASASNCTTCLDAGCAWFPNVPTCESNCQALADADCYSSTPTTTSSGTTTNTTTTTMSTTATSKSSSMTLQLCFLSDTAMANRELCFAQTTCASCLATIQSDGLTTCQWYTDNNDDNDGLSWCGTGECNVNGICGRATCNGIDEGTSTSNNDTTTTTTIMPNTTQTPTSTLEPTSNSANGTDTNTSITSPIIPTAAPIIGGDPNGCAAFTGSGSGSMDSCVACLSDPAAACAWSANTCLPSCNGIADASCIVAASTNPPSQTDGSTTTTPTTTATTVQELCEVAFVQEQEEQLCASKTYCTTCLATFLSDGITTCSWYLDDATGTSWCGRGGCNSNGICGSTNATLVCQVPTDPPFTSAPAVDFTLQPTVKSGALASTRATTTRTRTIAWTSILLLGLLFV